MRKKLLIGLMGIGATASALAQGSIVFENALSTGSITIGPNTGPASYAAAGSYTVALLWAPGTSPVQQSAFTVLGIYGAATGGATSAGFFFDGHVLTTGNATVGGTPAIFEVQGWLGSYTSYSQAVGAGAAVGQTAEFINNTAGTLPPQPPPVNLTGWDGNLILVAPEPGTLA